MYFISYIWFSSATKELNVEGKRIPGEDVAAMPPTPPFKQWNLRGGTRIDSQLKLTGV